MKIEINNMIPTNQHSYKPISQIKDILSNLPNIPKMNDTYSHLKQLISKYPDIIRIDIIQGIHKPIDDLLHFNIRVYDKRCKPNNLIYDNLHVYVTQDPITNHYKLNRFIQITF